MVRDTSSADAKTGRKGGRGGTWASDGGLAPLGQSFCVWKCIANDSGPYMGRPGKSDPPKSRGGVLILVGRGGGTAEGGKVGELGWR